MTGNRYYPENRFQTPRNDKPVDNPYDVDSAILQDMNQRSTQPFVVIPLNLTTASTDPDNASGVAVPTKGQWIEMKMPGNHVAFLGYDRSSSNQATITTVFAEFYIGHKAPNADDIGFPLKHNRGHSGPFERFWIRWPAQTAAANTSANLIIYRYQHRPWINGEAGT